MRLEQTHFQQEREITFDPAVLARAASIRGIWHETETEFARGLAAARERALLLTWVRREMGRRLSPRERRFLEQHYFNALTRDEVARRNGVHKTTVDRGLRRAVDKLRRAALENGTGTPEDDAVVRAIKNRTR